MEGYDTDAIQELPVDLYCVICMKLMRNPVQFKCGHGMCYSCYKNLDRKTKQRPGEEPSCPQCREVIREHQVVSNVMLHRIILSLLVKCAGADCFWIGELSELENHLLSCAKSGIPKEKRNAAERAKITMQTLSRNTNATTLHNDMLVTLCERITKIEYSLDVVATNMCNCEKNNQGQTTTGVTKKSTRKKSEGSKSTVKSLYTKEHLTTYIILMSIFAFFIIYLLTAKLFLSFERQNHEKVVKNEQTRNLFQGSQGDFQLFSSITDLNFTENFQTLRKEFLSTYDTLMQFVMLNQYMILSDFMFKEKEILYKYSAFYQDQNSSITTLSTKFYIHIEQTRRKINENLSLFDQEAVKNASLTNVECLQPLLHDTATYLNSFIFSEIDLLYVNMVEKARLIVHEIKFKLQELQENVLRLIDHGTRSSNLTLMAENSEFQRKLVEVNQNISASITSVDQSQIFQVVSQEIDKLRLKYEFQLNGYYANISYALSYKQRFTEFAGRMELAKHVRGNFIWKVNHTMLEQPDFDPCLTTNHSVLGVYVSLCCSGLELCNITYTQEKIDQNIQIFILNPIEEKRLECKTQSNIKKLKKFVLPVTLDDLKAGGFVLNHFMYFKIKTLQES